MSKGNLEWRLTHGRLHRLHRGVYAVGHIALTQRSRELAAVLACGPTALLSHRSAAALWGLLRSAPRIEVTTERSREARNGFTVHRSRRIDPQDRAERDGIPVTSVARTLVDLADVLSERRLEDALHEAEVQRLFDLAAVHETLARLPGRSGAHKLRRTLSAYDNLHPHTRSQAEATFLEICTQSGLPRPETNASIAGYEVDAYWRAQQVAVEVDGQAVHHTAKAFEEDRRRDRTLAERGIHVIRVTWRDLQAPAGLARQLEAILARR